MNSIFIANSKRLFCDSLSNSCTYMGLKVIGQSTNGLESINLINQLQPNFILLDSELTYFNGFEIARRVKKNDASIKVILFVCNQHAKRFSEILYSHIDYLLFEEDSIEKLKAYFSQYDLSINNHLSTGSIEGTTQYTEVSYGKLNHLTPTQLRILSLVSTYRTMPEIAKLLFISPHTVNNHIANIRKKLNIKGRGVILKYALEVKDELMEIDGEIVIRNQQVHCDS